MSIADYALTLRQLLPKGDAWGQEPGTIMSGLLTALAGEMARADSRMADLLEEADPRTATELLGRWEGVAGLPDDCTGELSSLYDRRLALHARLTETGGQSVAFYKGVALNLGYVIDINEFRPFTAGSRVGDRVYSTAWRHVWEVVLYTGGVPANVLQCTMERIKPAHTTVMFTLASEDTTEPTFFFNFTTGL